MSIKYDVAGVVHRGEFVMSADTVSRVGVRSLESIQSGGVSGGSSQPIHVNLFDDPQKLTKHMRDNPDKAGYFRFVLDSDDPRARRLERVVAWRSRVLGLPYGDQGLLIHRDLLRAVGGMNPVPLMEDVDLVRRLGRSRLVPLAADAVTSAHKWESQGYLRRSARNLLCLSLWFAGLPPEKIKRIYG